MADIYKCHYCGLRHDYVECAGIYYCPNPLCSGSGAAWFRRKCKSYKETDEHGGHTVDINEWISLARIAAVPDETVRDAAERSALKWKESL